MYRIRKQLIKSLSQTLTEGINELGENYQAVQMLPEFEKIYPGQLKPEIVSVRFYQTVKACYLETTIDVYKEKGIDPDIDNNAGPYKEYSRVDYRIHRHSLSYVSTGEDHAFSPDKLVLENAADFCESDEYGLIMITDLFTEKAAKEINERYLEQKRTNSDDEYDFQPGEIEFPGESLKDLDGYDSDDDPEFPRTPMATIRIDEKLTEILLDQNDTHIGKGQPIVQGNLPSFVEIRSATSEDLRLTTLSIPKDKIKSILVKAGNAPWAEYDLPGKYEYLVELSTGERLIIEGEFGEDWHSGGGLPEHWFYEHKIRVE